MNEPPAPVENMTIAAILIFAVFFISMTLTVVDLAGGSFSPPFSS